MLVPACRLPRTSSRVSKRRIASFAHAPNQRAHFMFLIRVEAVRRLIEHEHFGVVNDRLRETRTMAITLRERLHTLMEDRLEKTHLDHPIHHPLPRIAGDSP